MSNDDLKLETWRAPTRKEKEKESLSQKLIKYSGGLIKNESQANFVLLIFILINSAIILYLFLN